MCVSRRRSAPVETREEKRKEEKRREERAKQFIDEHQCRGRVANCDVRLISSLVNRGESWLFVVACLLGCLSLSLSFCLTFLEAIEWPDLAQAPKIGRSLCAVGVAVGRRGPVLHEAQESACSRLDSGQRSIIQRRRFSDELPATFLLCLVLRFTELRPREAADSLRSRGRSNCISCCLCCVDNKKHDK